MTVCALETFEFVLSKNHTILFKRFVAGIACYLGVPALEFKSCIIMVEIADAPLFKPVAARTICDAASFELPAVHCLVAICAGGRQAGKVNMPARLAFNIRFVASRTFLPGVRPLQVKIRQAVVEVVLLPTRRRMAIFTGLIGVILLIQMAFVLIFMAACTPHSDISEGPFFVFQVAGKAGCRQVRPVQRKPGLAVVFKGV